MRPKLTIPAQIKDMREAGITFDIISESEARHFLEIHTYYFKLKAYAKNYDKYSITEKQGQYINLDFAYLMDLSQIDSCLRKLIMKMTIDFEHYLKVKMLSDFNKTYEDGYDIIRQLFSNQPDLVNDIERRSDTSTCNEIIAKYRSEWAIWNIVEVISLGDFIELYALFYSRNDFEDSYVNMLLPVRMLRNAAAHNSCLLNRLRPPYSRVINPSYDLRNELFQSVGLSKKAIEKKLIHPAIHDFSVLLFLFSRIVPESSRRSLNTEMRDLFFVRMLANKGYYEKSEVIKSSYDFISKIVDFYC